MPASDLTPPASLACIGVGALGLPMAANLQAAGYALRVHTRSHAAESDSSLVDATPSRTPAAAVLGLQGAAAVRQRRCRCGVCAVG